MNSSNLGMQSMHFPENETLDTLLERLNGKQLEAVKAPPGPVLILAGAGSGKTRVLTHRIAYLIKHYETRPWNILAVTFTNKAAEEMANRVAILLPELEESIPVSTFHRAAARILRRHIDLLGYTPDFAIFDDSDQVTLLRHVLKDLELNPKTHDARHFRHLIDRAKNDLQRPDQIEKGPAGASALLPEVYTRYQRRLQDMNVVDFGDIILLAVRLLEQFSEVRAFYHNRIRHLLIDEYQDTNLAQYRLSQLLLHPETRSITVVGDEDQSIYAFRGADINNILNFEKDFPGATIIKLEQNYRSTSRILGVAGAVVSRNTCRIGKTLWSQRGEGEFVRYIEVESDFDEAARVFEEVQRLRSSGWRYEGIAIFYRAHFQSRLLEEVLNHHLVPYLLIGPGFYERKEIKDMRAYLQLIHNPRDDVALDRILNEPPRGIGKKARTYLFEGARERGLSCFRFLHEISRDTSAHKFRPKLAAFYEMMVRLRERARSVLVDELLVHILEKTGYRQRLLDAGDIESEGRLENLQELVVAATELQPEPGTLGLQQFLERISLRSQVDDAEFEEGRITLMTLHNAKGLEFPVVFMVGMEDGLFPHQRTLDNEAEIEEERRLCYVGMTRAMDRLFLLRARRRRVRGERQLTRPSRFLSEIPSDLLKGRRGVSRGVGRAFRYQRMGGGGSDTARNEPRRGGHASGSPDRGEKPPAWRDVSSFLASQKGKGRTPREGMGGNASSSGKWGTSDSVLTSGGRTEEAELEGPFKELSVGRRVIHPSFGEGLIKRRRGSPDNPRLTIHFRNLGEKMIQARYAGLEVVYE